MSAQEIVQGATPPPPGRIPNFENPEDVLHTINLVSQILAVAITTPIVALRLWVRWKINPPFLIDDWCCLVASILSILYSCTAFTMNKFGGGYHSWELPASVFQNYLKALYADTIIYGPNAWFVKVTLLLVVIRVFSVNRNFVIFGYSFIAAMVAYYFPVMILKINICRPISGFWDSSITSKCLNQRAIFVADTVVSAVTDLAVLLAPVPVIMALNMSFKQKAKVYLLLGAGGVATIASFVRMYLVIQLQKSDDQTVDFVRFNLLGTAEVTIGLICACMPTLNRLYQSHKKPEEQIKPPPPRGSRRIFVRVCIEVSSILDAAVQLQPPISNVKDTSDLGAAFFGNKIPGAVELIYQLESFIIPKPRGNAQQHIEHAVGTAEGSKSSTMSMWANTTAHGRLSLRSGGEL